MATIPAERATWDAERTRVAGPGDPGAWDGAAKAWQDLSYPHRAGYAWWRQAQALLDAGLPAVAAACLLRSALAAAGGHVPLLDQIRTLAERARISLQPPPADEPGAPLPAQVLTRYGLTDRELTVLQLLAAGRTNPQIGAELYISASTASVHVSNILRKLGVSAPGPGRGAGRTRPPAWPPRPGGRPPKGAPRRSKRRPPPLHSTVQTFVASSDLGQGSGALAWPTGNFSSSDYLDIAQLRDNDGTLSMLFYADGSRNGNLGLDPFHGGNLGQGRVPWPG